MSIAYIDLETSPVNAQVIYDYGAEIDGKIIHTTDVSKFYEAIKDCHFVCGHNIIRHDLVALSYKIDVSKYVPIDTLFLSSLLYPEKESHELGKEEQLLEEQKNNPLTDSIKAKDLFLKEVADYKNLPENLRLIYSAILCKTVEFKGFLEYIEAEFVDFDKLMKLIKEEFGALICSNADFKILINDYPIELAYSLAIIKNSDENIKITNWIVKNFTSITDVLERIRMIPCGKCQYCTTYLNIKFMLNKIFHYENFRSYGDKPLQEQAAQSAIDRESLLAIFPTGGGKSITFQLPALIQGIAVNGLTVVISPLQSLMKDQIDELRKLNILNATTINGLLDPIERSANFNLLVDKKINLIYIAPESLRSDSMQKALFEQNIIRFVIDEAHCFSTWGQEFRVDYQYIGDFINEYQNVSNRKLPVSCFTATAKQHVIKDITDYFKDKLNLDLKIYEAESKRENLHYHIEYCKDNEDKYKKIRDILEKSKVPTIIYCARTKKTYEIAERLSSDGISALPFNGKMQLQDKKENMEAFMQNKVLVMVATSAFGMGVNKSDVKFVIHYDISDSLENYLQEAGRAGRSQSIQADCLILFNKDDVNKHFNLLNKTKLSFNEIYTLWNDIKKTVPEEGKTVDEPRFVSSPVLAKEAGWQREEDDLDTSIKTAISLLEQRDYLKRCNNRYSVKATSINGDIINFTDGLRIIEEFKSDFKDHELEYAKRILHELVSDKYKELAGDTNAKANAELLAFRLGIPEDKVIVCINKMRRRGIIADAQDMTVYMPSKVSNDSLLQKLGLFSIIEDKILQNFSDTVFTLNIKELNEELIELLNTPKKTYIKPIKHILHFLIEKNYIKRTSDKYADDSWIIELQIPLEELKSYFKYRINISKFIINKLYQKLEKAMIMSQSKVPVHFSHNELLEHHVRLDDLFTEEFSITNDALDEALLYLVRCNILNISGNFLVLYNRLGIKRLVLDNKRKFTRKDYEYLETFYKQRTHQIHIAKKYCDIMLENPQNAEIFSLDYFKLPEKQFLKKYFTEQERKDMERTITAEKYNEIFGTLSEEQLAVIDDSVSQFIVVAAGPGSGKTKLLVHKLASLLTVEETPAEQLLMLTFSRAAAIEFKIRLKSLIPNLANIAIKTFHSFCFDLLGRKGDLQNADNIIKLATELIKDNQVEPKSVTKQVVVIDEAQDMDLDEFNLIKSLIEINDNLRVIAVGDDDQNIYEFRNSSSKFMSSFLSLENSSKYELTTNYRSAKEIVEFSNQFVKNLRDQRLKENEIQAFNKEITGTVRITTYLSAFPESGIVDEVVKLNKESGTKCIAVSTNLEALNILSLLLGKGYKAKLIQSNDGFNLYNLLEIRDFLKKISLGNDTAQIAKNIWNDAVEYIKDKYKNSISLEVILNIFEIFDKVNPEYKYKTDFEEFIKESKLDDFYKPDEKTIYVSTIHQTKGREFDYMFILLRNIHFSNNDEEIRKLYVGFTRAKKYLSIHCYKSEKLVSKPLSFVQYINDNKKYKEPTKIILNLSLEDVFLGYFKKHKSIIMKLKTGLELNYEQDNIFSVLHNGKKINILKLSKKGFSELKEKLEKGWAISKAYIRFIVAWKPKDATKDEKETAVILPTIELVKK